MTFILFFEKHKRLNNLVGVLAGDMLNGRTIHSLIRGLAMYPSNILYLLSPKELRLSKEHLEQFSKTNIQLIQIESEGDIPINAHFWYWTRVQKERFKNLAYYEKVKNKYVVTNELLKKHGNQQLIIMHPLPRVGEIDVEVDEDPRAVYLTSQVRNGMYIRMALLKLILKG